MSTHADDAGMRAVARVRSVRESDSRVGLQTALLESRSAQTKVEDLRDRIASAAGFATGSAAEFLALRASLGALGDVLITAEEHLDESRTISEAAYLRWQQDRTRLAAIEMLLDRRAAARRAERERAEARELDDIAAQRWLGQQRENLRTEASR